jgi:Na+-transporting NADH:ubiquinone oxidoreductase subunit C
VRKGNLYTFVFIVIISSIAAFLLAVTSQLLKEKQQINVEKDMKKNILTAVGFTESENCSTDPNPKDKNSYCDLVKIYKTRIKSFIIDNKGLEKKSDISPEKIDLNKEMAKPEEKRNYPVFQKTGENGVEAYCIPLAGKGLWGKIYGYIALEKDLNTVKGVTFYKHSETPGLGAEIESKWFLNNFKGKKILDKNNNLISIKVVKGKADKTSENFLHEVDGISGATITADAVTKLIKQNLFIYEPYFIMIRKGVK